MRMQQVRLTDDEAFGIRRNEREALAMAHKWIGKQRGWYKRGGACIASCKVRVWEALGKDLAARVACATRQPTIFRMAMAIDTPLMIFYQFRTDPFDCQCIPQRVDQL